VTLRLNGSTSGYTEIDAPAVAGSNTLVLPTGTGSAYQVVRNGATAGSLEFTDKIVSGTAVASTSGTSIDFTGIPSWVKRVTIMLAGVSLSGISNLLIQAGTGGSPTTTGYLSTSNNFNTTNTTGGFSSTSGFALNSSQGAPNITSGHMVLTNISGNSWVSSHSVKNSTTQVAIGSGDVTLGNTLNMIRITTVNGTDTFDAGSINILYE
jgi:hypothetical protein